MARESTTRGAFAGIGQYDALVLAAAIWFLAKYLRYAFPPLFDELKLVFGVSNAELGAAFTGFMVIYAVMQFPSGILVDRFSGPGHRGWRTGRRLWRTRRRSPAGN
jgi:MFS family permease